MGTSPQQRGSAMTSFRCTRHADAPPAPGHLGSIVAVDAIRCADRVDRHVSWPQSNGAPRRPLHTRAAITRRVSVPLFLHHPAAVPQRTRGRVLRDASHGWTGCRRGLLEAPRRPGARDDKASLALGEEAGAPPEAPMPERSMSKPSPRRRRSGQGEPRGAAEHSWQEAPPPRDGAVQALVEFRGGERFHQRATPAREPFTRNTRCRPAVQRVAEE